MGLCDTPSIPDPAKAATAGIQADLELQPFNYLINAASTLGKPITLNGKTYDFTGLGQADTASKVSDQMAQAMLDLQKLKSPELIQQRLDELKAADPQGYAARQQLFDRIIADSKAHPNRPLASDLQQTLQNELAKGAGFDDARQAEQVREGVRGQQVRSGIYRGTSPATNEAKTVVGAGESLRNQRQQNALSLLESGASPEDVAYRRMQQSLSNLGSFVSGQTPTAQFKELSSAGNVMTPPAGAPSTNTFNPGAAGQGLSNALGIYSGQTSWANSQANPWLAGLSTAATTAGSLNKQGAFAPGGIWGPPVG